MTHLHHTAHPATGPLADTVNPILVRMPDETLTDYYYRLIDYWTRMEPLHSADR